MAHKVENNVEDYLYCQNDNMIPLESDKNIIGLEECLGDNITEQILPEVTDIKIEEEIVSCTLKSEIDDHLDNEVLFDTKDTNYVNEIQLKDDVKYEEIELCESVVEKNFITKIHDNITSDVKMEDDDAFANNIRIKFENTILSCDHCNEDYEDYCIKCNMLVYILNGNTLNNIDKRAGKEIPNNLVEIKESFGHPGVYSLKHIPEGVKFGPFTGLKASEDPFKIKEGRFVVDNDKLDLLNWMQFINPAQNILEHNLVVFQNGENIYYRSTREIQEGEECLVYFGEKYEISTINGNEMDFTPTIETDIEDVFACTFCCLGFNTMVYLNKHKTVCPNDTSEDSSNKDIMQCPDCKIYLEQWEYFEYHMPRCRDENDRQCVLSTAEDQMSASSAQNKQKELYRSDIGDDTLEHHETKTTYNCSTYYQTFKQQQNLKVHVTNVHVNDEKTEVVGCFLCEYEIKSKSDLKKHFERNHIEDGKYRCTKCTFDTNYKRHLKEHFNAHKYSKCDYATSNESYLQKNLSTHEGTKQHKCSKCDYATNDKCNLQKHFDVHERTKRFKCSKCDYATNYKRNLQRHLQSHEGTKRFKCSKCNYATNYKRELTGHVLDHEGIKRFKCSKCDYGTNKKSHLKQHFDIHEETRRFKCSKCDYETNYKYNLQKHFDTHEGTKRFKCSKCEFATNNKGYLPKHFALRHEKRN